MTLLQLLSRLLYCPNSQTLGEYIPVALSTLRVKRAFMSPFHIIGEQRACLNARTHTVTHRKYLELLASVAKMRCIPLVLIGFYPACQNSDILPSTVMLAEAEDGLLLATVHVYCPAV